MKKFTIQQGEASLRKASLVIRSGYSWGPGWDGDRDAAEMFQKEIREKLRFGGFNTFKEGTEFAADRIVYDTDNRFYVYCHPMELSYFGPKDGLDALVSKLEEGRFDSFVYCGMGECQEVYEMTKEQLESVLEANKDVIRDNILERVAPGGKKDRYRSCVIEDVFESVRFPNSYDRSYMSCWCTEELTYKKVAGVFEDMLKRKEIVMDDKRNVYIAPQKKRGLRPQESKQNGLSQDGKGMVSDER